MANYQYMMSAEDVAKELNCSKSHAYKLIKSMNKELDSQGYVTMPGRIPRAFWATKMFGYYVFFNKFISLSLQQDFTTFQKYFSNFFKKQFRFLSVFLLWMRE